MIMMMVSPTRPPLFVVVVVVGVIAGWMWLLRIVCVCEQQVEYRGGMYNYTSYTLLPSSSSSYMATTIIIRWREGGPSGPYHQLP